MPLEFEEVKEAIEQMGNKNFVPPVDWFDLGKYAFNCGIDWAVNWRKEAIQGWQFASWKCFKSASLEDVKAAMAFAESIT